MVRISISVAYVCEKRDRTCTLYRNGYLTLVLCASSGHSAGQDLGTLAYALSESRYILIIDMIDLIGAEDTYLLVLTAAISRGTGRSCGSGDRFGGSLFGSACHYFVIHCINTLSLDFAQRDRSPFVVLSDERGLPQNGRSSSFDISSNCVSAAGVDEN